ncbi:PTS sugar transporter subunit IIA [Candidatus Sumerlaeota bacterium]|nr:PTS sugar transporter subunit IIA [Candidatus Sumerlaeota bacterium]
MPFSIDKMISADRIVDLKSSRKEDVLNELINLTSTSPFITEKKELREKIFERERTVSTGVGVGLATPHAKIASVKDFVISIGICRGGMDFDSLDGNPTFIIVMIACNNTQSADFLKVLAHIVKYLKLAPVQRRIIDASSKDEVRDIFLQPMAADA